VGKEKVIALWIRVKSQKGSALSLEMDSANDSRLAPISKCVDGQTYLALSLLFLSLLTSNAAHALLGQHFPDPVLPREFARGFTKSDEGTLPNRTSLSNIR
jgi:hypothetical protein